MGLPLRGLVPVATEFPIPVCVGRFDQFLGRTDVRGRRVERPTGNLIILDKLFAGQPDGIHDRFDPFRILAREKHELN